MPFLLKQQKLALADESLNLVRFAGNLVVAAFFAGDNDKKRKLKREELLQQFAEYLRTGNMALRPDRRRSRSCAPATRRFIRFTGRSSFRRCSAARTAASMRSSAIRRFWAGAQHLGESRRSHISTGSATAYEESHGNADLVAHFFRRAFDLTRARGALRPDRHEHDCARATRASLGFAGSAHHGGTIYAARRR